MFDRRLIVCMAMLMSVFTLVSGHGKRQIHIEQISVRFSNDETKKFDGKPSAYFTKKCESKNRCSANWYFKDPKMVCPDEKKKLVATVRCGSDEKSICPLAGTVWFALNDNSRLTVSDWQFAANPEPLG